MPRNRKKSGQPASAATTVTTRAFVMQPAAAQGSGFVRSAEVAARGARSRRDGPQLHGMAGEGFQWLGEVMKTGAACDTIGIGGRFGLLHIRAFQGLDSRRSELADEKTYSAVYLGSGTFVISKPKRKRAKLRQSRLKNPQRGARK